MIKYIIFDFDGVLVESVDVKTKAFAKLFQDEDEEIVRKVVDYHIRELGLSRFEKFKYIYKEILKKPLTDERFNYLCKKFSQLVVDEVINAPYVRGASEFLNNHTELYKYFISSGTPQEEMEEILKRRQIYSLFSEIYGSPKKKADIVREILLKYGLETDKVVYIGDALSDYEAAKVNNIQFIARIHSSNKLFDDIDCIKTLDLQDINTLITDL